MTPFVGPALVGMRYHEAASSSRRARKDASSKLGAVDKPCDSVSAESVTGWPAAAPEQDRALAHASTVAAAC